MLRRNELRQAETSPLYFGPDSGIAFLCRVVTNALDVTRAEGQGKQRERS